MKKVTESARNVIHNKGSQQGQTAQKITDSKSVSTTAKAHTPSPAHESSDFVDLAIAPRVCGFGSTEFSNVHLLHFICMALDKNATLIRQEILLNARPDDAAVALAEGLLIARQIARSAAWKGLAADPKPTAFEFHQSPVCETLFMLPGLASLRQERSTLELLSHISKIMLAYSDQISSLIIEPASDLENALELAEALVVAEQVEDKYGGETEIGKKGGGAMTKLQLQARALKMRVLLKAA